MNQYYPNLFSPIYIGKTRLKNRIVMSAMDTHMFAMDGTLTPTACAHYLERAKGGVGLIFTEISPFTWPGGKGGRREPRFNSPLVTTEWADLIERVHSFDVKICAQLNHAGFISTPDWCDGRETLIPYAVKEVATTEGHQDVAREINESDIKEFKAELEKCLNNIRDCGFDGVEFHAGHDYLFNIFLSPATNKRSDAYGGSVENRARLLCECVEMARKVMGPDKIVSVKLAVNEEIAGGIDLDMGVEYAKLCEAAGANLIDCTIGQGPDGSATEAEFLPDGRRLHSAAYIKPHMTTARVGVVGKLRTPEMCEEAIKNGDTDLVFLARALLTDPYWAYKAEIGKPNEIRKCISCRKGCFGALRTRGARIRCVLNPYLGFEDKVTERCPGKADFPKRILIAGGGISGMQAAIIAKKRGHDVTIVEKGDTLGGQMFIAGIPPFKSDIHEVMNWYVNEVKRLGIEVVFNQTVDKAYIEGFKPEAVLIATGAHPFKPPVQGIESAVDGWDILKKIADVPRNKRVAVIGGGTVGCEIAETLISFDNHVAIIEMEDTLNKKQDIVHRNHVYRVLEDANADIFTSSSVKSVFDGGVEIVDFTGNSTFIQCDLVFSTAGQMPDASLCVTDIRSMGIDAYLLGDAISTGDFQTATRSAMDIVMNL